MFTWKQEETLMDAVKDGFGPSIWTEGTFKQMTHMGCYNEPESWSLQISLYRPSRWLWRTVWFPTQQRLRRWKRELWVPKNQRTKMACWSSEEQLKEPAICANYGLCGTEGREWTCLHISTVRDDSRKDIS